MLFVDKVVVLNVFDMFRNSFKMIVLKMTMWYTEKGTRLNQEKCVLAVTPVSNLIILGRSVKFSGTQFYCMQNEFKLYSI